MATASQKIRVPLGNWLFAINIYLNNLWYYIAIKFVVIPPVFAFSVVLSTLLTIIVILGRIFSTPVRLQDMFDSVEESGCK